MPATRYKIETVGNRVVDGAGNPMGVTGAVNVFMAGIAKPEDPREPYLFVNEIVCNSIARHLLLPCPPGAMMDSGGSSYFFSLNFNTSGHSLPPMHPPTAIARVPELCWGVVLFDALIMNIDRHANNISFDTTTDRLTIFDHSHSFIYPARTEADISTSFAQRKDQLCQGASCLVPHMNTTNGRDMWLDRIKKIPDYFIEGVIDSTLTVGLPSSKKQECIDILFHRRDNLSTIVSNAAASFTSLP